MQFRLRSNLQAAAAPLPSAASEVVMVTEMLSKDTTRRLIAIGFCAAVIISHFIGIICMVFSKDNIAAYAVPGKELIVIVGVVVGFYFGADAALKKPGEDQSL